MKLACILEAGSYQPGDPPPEGYLQWHEWARVQVAARLRQQACPTCSLWKFPQELSTRTIEVFGSKTKHGPRTLIGIARVCLECATQEPRRE